MVPSSDALPEVRAWTPADARLKWCYKEDAKEYAIVAFGGALKCAGWLEGEVSDDVTT